MDLILSMIFAVLLMGRRPSSPVVKCMHCELLVHNTGNGSWAHSNGQRYMPYPGLRTQIMHPASPSSLF